jgi:prefoldin subunit 2
LALALGNYTYRFSGMSTASAEARALSKDEVLSKYSQMRQDEAKKRAKIQELSTQAAEFRMVIDTLKPIDPDRRCYHQTGAVLCERTVKEVLPVLESNHDGLVKLLSHLEGEFSKFNQERLDFQVCTSYPFRFVSRPCCRDSDVPLILLQRTYGIQVVPQGLLNQRAMMQQSGVAGGKAVGIL